MTTRRLPLYFSLAILVVVLIGLPSRSQYISTNQASDGLSASRNVNMISGLQLPWGDPFLQRQNEPSIAVSTRNPMHILAGANDYRTVDMLIPYEEIPGFETTAAARDAWLGLYKSYDGCQSWISTLLPGFPLDYTSQGSASPLKAYGTGADPVVRAGANGMFYYAGLVFNRNAVDNAVFVARLIDNNNAEDKNSDQIKYIDAKIIAKGNVANFIDKPWMAVDIPRGKAKSVAIQAPGVPLQYVTASNVYLAYSVFTGQDPLNPYSRVYFLRSDNCGKDWGKPLKLSESAHLNQGVTIAIAPSTGNVYVAWRRFARDGIGNAVMFCYSTDKGTTFSMPAEVAAVQPFDQGTTGTSFRTNSYPSLTVDHNGLIYLAWSQRGGGPGGDARIVYMTSMNGVSWSGQQAVDNHPGRGHQFMPTLSYAAGKVTAAWYDQRRDISEHWDPYISDEPGGHPNNQRHTTDVRAAQAPAGGSFDPSIQVSRYLFWIDPSLNLYQIHHNPPNFPLFKEGTRPFHGDYIDLTPVPMFVPTASGGWTFNTDGSKTSVFHAAWTDNRNVKPPADGNWSNYTPPDSAQDPLFDSNVQCSPGQTGMRNQDVYTSSLTGGLIVGSPGNTKPLDSAANTHTFVVFAKNMTQWQKSFKLTIAAPSTVSASFLQFESCPSLTVDIASYSSISRTVFANSSVRKASFKVNVEEVDANGNPVIGGLKGTVILNPDIQNPDIQNPDIQNNELHNPDIQNPEVENPDIQNVIILNPDIQNPDIQNTDIINPDIQNPDIQNPDIQNPDIQNEAVLNPDIQNPDIQNPDIQNGAIYDYTWKVNNVGNTTSAYAFKMISAGFDESSYPGFGFQLLIYRVHTSPVAIDCTLLEQHSDELIANIVGPVIFNPDIQNPDIQNPDIQNPDIQNATFWLAPGDQAFITLRWYDPNKFDQIIFDPVAEALEGVTTAQAVNSENEDDPYPTPPMDSDNHDVGNPLTIYNSYLPDGTQNSPYSTFLVALGGTPHYTWNVAAGSLPTGLSLNSSSGEISGTPTALGSFAFTVAVTDSKSVSATKQLTIAISSVACTLAVSKAGTGAGTVTSTPAGIDCGPDCEGVFNEGSSVQLTAAWAPGSIFSGWSGDVPAGQETSNPVTITMDTNKNLTATFTAVAPLVITTTSIPDGINGTPYDTTLQFAGGLPPVTWSISSGALPDGLNLNSGTGQINGTPTESGYFPFTVQATDVSLQIVSQALSMTIAEWVARYSGLGSGADQAEDIAVDSAGNVYVTGSSTDNPTITQSDFCTIKYSNEGVQQWVAKFNRTPVNSSDMAAAIAVDSAGNVYVTGSSMGSGTQFDYCTIKYNDAGAEQWVVTYNSSANGPDMASDIAVDSSGNVYVTGYSTEGGSNTDFCTIKYDKDGVEQWTAKYNRFLVNGADRGVALAVDSSGNVYVTGYSTGSGSDKDYCTVKYNSDGVQQWADAYNGSGNGPDEASAITVDSLGNVYVTGYSYGPEYKPGHCTIKYNSSGAQMWAVYYTGQPFGSKATDIALDSFGNIYVTGTRDDGLGGKWCDTVKYDNSGAEQWVLTGNPVHLGIPGAITVDPLGNIYITGSTHHRPTNPSRELDQITVKYDTSSALQWVVRYNGPGNDADGGAAIAIDPLGNVCVTGSSFGSGTFVDYATIKYAQSFPSTLIISTETLDNGFAGTPYAKAIWAFGGSGSRTWSIIGGALPPGIILNGVTGILAGTPTTPGIYNFTVQVGDGGLTATKGLSISIAPSFMTYTISGTVTLEGAPLAGVVMSGLPLEPATNPSGQYAATVDYGWSGTATPTLAGYTFTPASTTYTDVSSDQTGQDYTATLLTYTISGIVTFGVGGPPLPDVVMSGLPGDPVTDGNSQYTATVNYGWSGTVTPTKSGYIFSPPSTTYTTVTSNQTQHYLVALIFGPASKIVFTQSPNGGVGGIPWTVQPTVQIQDADGNRVTSDDTTVVTLAILNNPGNGTLSGTVSMTVTDGEASFAGLSINKGGYAYTLTATSAPPLNGLASDTFNIEGFSNTINTMGSIRSSHTATTLGTDKVLITGGWTGADALNSVDLYDPSLNTFTAIGNMDVARFAHAATLLLNGKILITGGGSSVTSAILFDPGSSTFSPAGNTNHARWGHAATLLQDGRVLITGNRNDYQDTAEIYDPVLGSFTATGNMNNNRNLHTSTLLPGGNVLITGGIQNADGSSALDTAELFHPNTGTFTPLGSMAGGTRYHHQATLLDDGRVLITGGSNAAGQYVKVAEVYDLDGTFKSIGDALYYHIGNQAALLRDGKVLLIGDYQSAGNEIFDPLTGTFRATGPSLLRANGAAAVLADGKVLITGGDAVGGTTATAEVWNPLGPFPTHVISGTITHNSLGVGGVLLNGLPGHPMTNDGGYYEGLVLDGWSGTVTPYKPGYTFNPASRTYTNVTGDLSGQDYGTTVGLPAKLAFSQQPTSTAAGATITPAVTVEIQDAGGNLVTTATNDVALTLQNGGSATLSGTLTRAAVGGMATFNDLSIDTIGTGYFLRATSGSLTAADSNTFNVTAGAATQILVETSADGSGTVVPAQAIPFGSSITVYSITRDSGNNFVENAASDSWSLVNNSGFAPGDLVAAGDGRSATLTPHTAGSAQIRAVKSGLTSVDSGLLSSVGTTAGKIELTGPAKVGAGFISEAFMVTSQDALGNPVNVPQNTVFNLTSNTTGTAIFYSDPQGTTPVTQVTILSGQSSASFYYMDNVKGTPTITATWASGGTDLGSDTHATSLWAVVGQIAFTSDRDGDNEIYIMNPDGTGQVRLTSTPGDDSYPSWSKDGSKIAFQSFRDGNNEIYVMKADGSWPVNLTNNPAADVNPKWSPDGTKIAFESLRDGNDEIYVMNADGTSPINLTNHPAFDSLGSWSPDGTKIAFMSTRDGDSEIFVMNADGSSPVQLTFNTVGNAYASWSPDGKKIAYGNDSGVNCEIYVMNSDGSNQFQLTNNSALDSVPSWSLDSSKIAFLSYRDGHDQVYVMNADGSGQTNITNSLAKDAFPDWGGAKIAFELDQAGVGEIYVMNADGTGKTNLTNNPANDRIPGWSPDGTKIAFSSDRASAGNYDIYVMDADGANVMRLTTSGADSYPRWSPDGTKIVFLSNRDGDGEIYVMNADGSGQTNLTHNIALDYTPSWSPYGDKIAFSSTRDGNLEIYVMNADGSELRRLTNNAAYDRYPSWSPDGTKISFETDRDESGSFEIYVMNANGLWPTRLTVSVSSESSSWSPDGRVMAFMSWETGNREIYVMKPDGTSLTRLTTTSPGSWCSYPFWRPQPHPRSEAYEFVAKWGSVGTGDGQFLLPQGIAVDNAGNVYVADNNSRIQKFTSAGTFLGWWGRDDLGATGWHAPGSGRTAASGSGDGEFDHPSGICVDSSGNIYVADSFNNRIQKFSSSGSFLANWGGLGAGDGQFDWPWGLAADASDNIYVADRGNDRIQKFNSSGGFLAKWGSTGNGDGQFNDLWGIAVDSSGYVYASDVNGRIEKFISTGTFLGWWGQDDLHNTGWHGPGSGRTPRSGSAFGQFAYPLGVAVDTQCDVFTTELYDEGTGTDRVQKFDSIGHFVATWGGTYGAGDGQFLNPTAIAIDSSGYVYVTDSENNRVQKFRKK